MRNIMRDVGTQSYAWNGLAGWLAWLGDQQNLVVISMALGILTAIINKQNNGWISLKDNPPKLSKNEFKCSSDLICFGQEDYTDEPHIFIGYMIEGNRFYSNNGECHNVSYWQPLPQPPETE